VGHVESLSAVTSGGIGTLTYAWSLTSAPAGSSAALSGAVTATPTFTPGKAGSSQVRLVVTDSNSVSSSPALLSVTVNAALNPGAITASPASPAAGTLVTLSNSASAGVPPYSYAWTLTGPAGSTAALSS